MLRDLRILRLHDFQFAESAFQPLEQIFRASKATHENDSLHNISHSFFDSIKTNWLTFGGYPAFFAPICWSNTKDSISSMLESNIS